MKTCSKCGETKALDAYYAQRGGKDGLAARCRACVAAYQAANPEKVRARSATYYTKNRERVRASAASRRAGNPDRRRGELLGRYGLTPEQFDGMLATQGGRCAICATPTPGGVGTWHVDHDHACCPGKGSCGACVRGLLCQRCNMAQGLFGDSVDNLTSAIAYLLRSTDALASLTAD